MKLYPAPSDWLAVAVCAILTGSVHAQSSVFRVEDAKGNVSYQSEQPVVGESFTEQDIENNPEPEEVADAAAEQRLRILQAESTHPLVLFSVPEDSRTICDACDYVRFFLNKHQLPFKELDAENDFLSQDRLKDVSGGYSVPVLMVGEKVVTGYSRDILERELQEVGYLEKILFEEIDPVEPEQPPESDENSAPPEADEQEPDEGGQNTSGDLTDKE